MNPNEQWPDRKLGEVITDVIKRAIPAWSFIVVAIVARQMNGPSQAIPYHNFWLVVVAIFAVFAAIRSITMAMDKPSLPMPINMRRKPGVGVFTVLVAIAAFIHGCTR